jgi:hypothetical protein
MSLFDTLRYPVNNIFSSEEMDKIPTAILKPWLDKLLQDCGYTDIVRIKDFGPSQTKHL